MNYKNLVIFSVIVSTILISTLGYLSYIVPIEEQKRIHNQDLVKNCIPVDSDDFIPTILIGNYTHIFDLRNCTWIPMEKKTIDGFTINDVSTGREDFYHITELDSMPCDDFIENAIFDFKEFEQFELLQKKFDECENKNKIIDGYVVEESYNYFPMIFVAIGVVIFSLYIWKKRE